jgi:outer membrane lipoprotein-sorting protein
MIGGAFAVSFAGLTALLGPWLGAWTDTWASIRTAAGGVSTLQADFVQTKHLKLLKKPIVSRGKLYYRRPSQVRWEYTSPVKSIVILNARGVRRYTWQGNRYVRDPSATLGPIQVVLGEMNLWLSGAFSHSRVFVPTLQAGPPPVVRLIPRARAVKQFVSSVELRLSSSPGVVDRIRIAEGPDTSTRIQLTHVKRNQPLADQLFQSIDG